MSCQVYKLLLFCVLVIIVLIKEAGSQYSPEEKLNIISKNGIALLKLGEKRALYCISIEPGIRWLDPLGSVVGPRDPSHHVHVEEVTGQLILMFVDPQLTDNGTWTCKARDIMRTIEVFVVEEAKFEAHEPVLTPMEGADQTLTCAARGAPKPTLSWHKDGALMTAASSPSKYDVWEGRLVVHKARREDSGEYECRAQQSNAVWNYTASDVTKLHVRHGPIMELGGMQKIYALYDHIRIIRCSASAFPKPRYRWSHVTPRGENTIPVYGGDIYTHKNGSYSELTVRVNGQDDLGDYVCYAKNTHGKNRTVFHLMKGRKPNPPERVEYNSSKIDAILFDVQCEKCIPIMSSEFSPAYLPEVVYRFEFAMQELRSKHQDIPRVYWEEDRDQILSLDVPRQQNSTTVCVAGLRANTTYVVRVASLNPAGPSDFLDLNKQFTTLARAGRQVPWTLLTIVVAAAITSRVGSVVSL